MSERGKMYLGWESTFWAVTAWVLGCTFPSVGRADARYSITDLGISPGYGDIIPNRINDSGVIVGTQYTPITQQAFIYSNGVLVDLGPALGNPYSSSAADVNASGTVVGRVSATGSSDHPFTYSGGSFTDLGTPAGSTSGQALGINSKGQVVGVASTSLGSQAFMYSNGVMSYLFPSVGNQASGINDAGTVAGSMDVNGKTRAVGPDLAAGDSFWSYNSSATRINSSGQIIGGYGTSSTTERAFLYSAGSIIDLGGGVQAYGINDSGVVVGDTSVDSVRSAFVYANGEMTSLNTLIPSNSGWDLWVATDVNNLGMIVGYGANPDGRFAAFLLTPVPEPLAFPFLVGCLAVSRRRRRN